MNDLIDREKLKQRMYHEAFEKDSDMQRWDSGCWIRYKMFENVIAEIPTAEPEAANMVKIPETGIGDLSDGYHTFNGLYEQRMILFAALVKAYKEKAWKSYRHEDGEYCFGGGWFIVGIDTPEGSYTYHYENKYWEMFDCIDLPRGKHWDGHTEADAETRLMSLEPERKTGKWASSQGYAEVGECYCSVCKTVYYADDLFNVGETSECGVGQAVLPNYCPHCGADMREEK